MEFIDFEAEDEDDDVAGSHGGYDEHQQYVDVDAEVCVVRARGPSAMHARFNNRLEMERDDAEIERLAQRYAPQRHAPQRHLPPPQRHLPPPRAPPRHAAPASGSAKLPTQARAGGLLRPARAGAPSCRATASRAPPSSSAAAAPRAPPSIRTVKDRMQASSLMAHLSPHMPHVDLLLHMGGSLHPIASSHSSVNSPTNSPFLARRFRTCLGGAV